MDIIGCGGETTPNRAPTGSLSGYRAGFRDDTRVGFGAPPHLFWSMMRQAGLRPRELPNGMLKSFV